MVCHVGICARDATAVAATAGMLTTKGIRAIGQTVHVGDGEALKAWVAVVAQALDGLDIVVSDVSGFGVTPDDAGWQRNVEIDVRGTVHAVEAAMPFLEASDAAASVVISSASAVEAPSMSFLPAGCGPMWR